MNKIDKQTKVLLCSPRGFAGGIAIWTEHILKYYDSQHSNSISLSWVYTKAKGNEITASTPFCTRVLRGLYNYVPFLHLLNEQLNSEHYDVVHFSTSASISLIKDWLSIAIAHKCKSRVVMHFHFGRIPEIYAKMGWEYQLLSKVVNKADAVVVLDNNSYATIIRYGYNNVYKLPNPLAVHVFERIRKKDIHRKKERILFVGHLVPSKGIFELIDACKGIANIQLTMIGNGTDEIITELRNKAGNNCDSWLNILGVQPHEFIIDSMLESSIFVLPSYTEGFPNVILESMACGCSIVATNVGAIPEMLNVEGNEVCGLCVKPKEIVTLKLAIERMLFDRIFAEQCGNNAQKRANKMYSMPEIWLRLTKIWKEVAITTRDLKDC